MQWLASISVRRPVFATVLILALVVIGLVGYSSLGVDKVRLIMELRHDAPGRPENSRSAPERAGVSSAVSIDTIPLTYSLPSHPRERS